MADRCSDIVIDLSFRMWPVPPVVQDEPPTLPPWRPLTPRRVPQSSAVDRWITDLDDSLSALLLLRLKEE